MSTAMFSGEVLPTSLKILRFLSFRSHEINAGITPETTTPNEHPPAEREAITISESDVDEAIATCGGDHARDDQAFLIAGQFLEIQLDEARQEAS